MTTAARKRPLVARLLQRQILQTFVLLITVALTLPILSNAQSNEYRASKRTVGAGVGAFTFHGPVDLWKPRNALNFVRKRDAAASVSYSFPLTKRLLFGRALVGYTNANRSVGRELLISGENEFIINDLVWFEPTIAASLAPGPTRFLPYLFGGGGLLIADPFGKNSDHRASIPPENIKRRQLYFPVGVGFDLALSPRMSFFLEGTWRLSKNAVFIDTQETGPFNTSSILGGLRFSLGRRTVEIPVVPEIPVCLVCEECKECPIVPIVPPADNIEDEDCCACAIRDLQRVSFDIGKSELGADALARLRDNAEVLQLKGNEDCEITVVAYIGDGETTIVGEGRAEAVIDYYVMRGVPSSRIRRADTQFSFLSCGKNVGTNECRENQFVDTLPSCAFTPTCPIPGKLPKLSPMLDR